MNPRTFFRLLMPLFFGILLTFAGIRLAAAGAPPKETHAGAAGNPAADGFAQPMSATINLHLSKTSVYTQAIPGTAITYTLWMSHSSPVTVTAARISDALPAALQNPAWMCALCAPVSGTGNVSASVTLPPTTTISVTLRAMIDPNALGTLTNTARLLPPLGMTDAFTADNTAQNIVLLTPQADLALTAAFTPTAPLPGDLLTITLTARNLGASSAHSLTLTGTLASLNAPLLTPSAAWTCGAGAHTFTCTLPTLVPAAPHTLTLSGFAPIEGGFITHTAALTAHTPADPNPLNNTIHFTHIITPQADLALTAAFTPTAPLPGDLLTITLTARNLGASTAHSLTLTGTLASLSAPLLTAPSWACGTGAHTFTCTLPTLVPAAPHTLTLSGFAPVEGGFITHTAALTALAPIDPNPLNNTIHFTHIITPQADLALTAAFTPTAPLPGDLLTITLTARNLGASTAHSLTLTGTLPNLSAPLLTAPSWACGAGAHTFTCTLPTLVPAAPHSVTLSGFAPIEGGLLTHTAALTARTPVDPNPLNNLIRVTHIITPQADLALMLHAPLTATPGLPLTYTLIVRSGAPYTVTNAALHVAAPPQFQTFAWACAGATCPQPAGSGTLTHTLTLAPNTPLTYTLGGTLSPHSSGTLTLTAHISTPPGTLDPAPANNTAAQPVSLMPQAAISLGYAQIITPAVPGLPYTVTLRAENAGPSAANAVTLHSAAAPWATVTFWGCAASAGGNCLPLTGTVALVDVPPFGFVTATLGLMLPPEATAPLTHTAALSIPATLWDTTPADNTVSFTLPLAPRADLALALSATPEPVGTDAVLEYHLLAQNLGPSAAITPTLTFTMPPGIISSTLTAPGWACNSLGDVFICGRAALTGSRALTVTVQTPNNSAPLLASAALTAFTPDPALENNRAVVTSTIAAVADVSVIFTLPAAVDPLQTFNLSAQVQNAGPTAAHALTITAALPDGFAVLGVNAPGWACGTITCTRPHLENAASAPVIWQLRAPQPSQTATFTLTVAAHTPDSALGNNTQVSTTLVRNLAPVVNAGTLRVGVEGSALTFGGSFSDPNGDPAAQLVWDFGDGQTLTGTLHPAHTYLDDGMFTVTLWVTDTLGAGGSGYTQAIIVNAPPVANAGPNRMVDEGSALTLLGAFSDAGVLDTHTLTWTLGDGAQVTNSLTVTHVYADDGAYAAVFAVRDDDGGMDDDSALITVRNVAPWVVLNAPAAGLPGQTLVFTGTFGDAGVLDTHILIWDFDDGTLTQTRGLTVTHVYTLEGDFNVTLTVRDDDGGEGSAVQPVNVRIPPVYTVYLPALANNYRADAPDLQVTLLLAPEKREFTAGEPVTLTVLITNAGSQPTSEPFWVDLYINPAVVPNTSNVPWSTVCTLSPCEGVAWYVTGSLLPGESLRLTTTPESYAADYTIWSGSFAAGTTAVYVYADSWKPGSASGAILERSESNNRGEILGLSVVARSRNAANLRVLPMFYSNRYALVKPSLKNFVLSPMSVPMLHLLEK